MLFSVLILAFIGAAVGGYLVVRPQAYKDEMAGLGHLFGSFPTWAIRILGVFLIAFVAGVSYLFFMQSR